MLLTRGGAARDTDQAAREWLGSASSYMSEIGRNFSSGTGGWSRRARNASAPRETSRLRCGVHEERFDPASLSPTGAASSGMVGRKSPYVDEPQAQSSRCRGCSRLDAVAAADSRHDVLALIDGNQSPLVLIGFRLAALCRGDGGFTDGGREEFCGV